MFSLARTCYFRCSGGRSGHRPGQSEGFTRLAPSIVFVVGLILSMLGLAYAMRDLPGGHRLRGVVGIGATLTVVFAMATGDEFGFLLKVLFLVMIVGGVVGLKSLH